MKLLDYWFPSDPTHNSHRSWKMQDDEIDQQKRYGHFAFGAVSDSFSLFHNTPQHIICLDQLRTLPHVLLDICSEAHSKEAKYLQEIDAKYWRNELKEFNLLLKQHESLDDQRAAEIWIEDLLKKSDFVSHVANIFKSKSNTAPHFNTDDTIKKFISLLIRMVPFIERRIFVTHINSPTPFYLISKQCLLFRLWFILWLYESIDFLEKNAKDLDNGSDPSQLRSEEIPGLPYWRIKCFSVVTASRGKTFLGIAGPYVQTNDDGEEISVLSKALSSLIKISQFSTKRASTYGSTISNCIKSKSASL